jgi:hypothetical protein
MKAIGFALLLILATTTLAIAAPPNSGVEPEALYDSTMYFDPYSVGVYEKTIAYGETYNGLAPSPVFMWYFALLIDGDLAKPRMVATNLPVTMK